MTKDISFFISSRSKDNANSALLISMARIFENATNPDRIEALIKFDDDDTDAEKTIEQLKQKPYFKNIKYLFAPRWRGYDDLHKAYNTLLENFKPESPIYWIISDDAEILCKGFDSLIMKKANIFEDGMFVMHGSPLVKMQNKTALESLEKCEPYPIWSKKWITTIGGFGETFSTDGLNSILEHSLWHRYSIDRRIFIPQLDIIRHMLSEDFGDSEKWDVKRKAGFEHMLGNEFKPRFDKMVDDIYAQIDNNFRSKLQKYLNKFWENRYYKKANKKIRRAKRKEFISQAAE